MTERILVATDLAEGPRACIERALAPYIRPSTRLAVCHVRDAAERHVHGLAQTEAAEELDRNARHAIEVWRDALPLMRDAELFVETGTPYVAVVARAESWGADLVVVAASGATGLRRVLLGSVAERIVRHARCSVLVARDSPEPGVVLGATDLSDASFPAVFGASEEARTRGRSLVITHVLHDPGPMDALLHTAENAPLYERRSSAVSWIHHALGKVGAHGTADVAEGRAARAVVRRAIELGAEVIVVAARGHTGLSRLLLGSVSEEICRSAPCSVLVVRR